MSKSSGLTKGIPPGFSLIEVVVALGIVSVAIVGIMGLFPVAMRSAQESQRETRAATIARQIFSDLVSVTGTNRFILTGSDGEKTTVNLATAATNSPIVIPFSATGAAQNGVDADSQFLAQVYVFPQTPVPGMTRVEALIQAPIAAPEANRAHYSFVTLVNQN